ncbi:MAG: electron transfer flavoprotein subunit alpha/FixB family protein, partial [Paraglaciecola sp.]|nr:electron transfer flavoprotein subunit alpha/FixB family protein [Paraglaciecola sp.]
MAILVYAEHDNEQLKTETHKLIHAASQLGGEIHLLVAGFGCADVATQASKIDGVSKVLLADNEQYAQQMAENIADLVTELGKDASHVLAAATTTGKNFMPRVAALLDVAQISDIIKVESADTFLRPIYAGNAIATVQSTDNVKVITVRTASFDLAGEGNSAPIEACTVVKALDKSALISAELSESERPELTAADVIISGGRGMQN